MAATEVIGDAPPDQVELDAAADAVAVGRCLGLLERQHLGLQQLQLQRHQQPVLRPPRPQPHETLARDEHLARHHGLQAVEIGEPVRVRLVGPGQPEPLDAIAQARVLDQRRRLDAVAHQVGRKGLAGIRRITVGHDQFPRAGQQARTAGGDQRVDVLQRRVPAPQPALDIAPSRRARSPEGPWLGGAA